jgi:hypothetical protein
LSAKNKKRGRAAEEVSSNPAWPRAAAAFLSRHSLIIALVAVAIASARIAATYTVFNQTFDEPLHIGCGIEWLGGVICPDETPPLARAAEAVGPYLLGARSKGTPYRNMDSEYTAGAQVPYHTGSYDLTLALARLGNLPFFWVACVVIYLWGLRYYGAGVAAAAVAFFSFLPPVLAHAGLATVDMALTAFLGAAFLSALAWLERRDATHGAVFGAATALAILAKYSALVFLPAALALALALYAILDRPGASRLAHAVGAMAPSFGIAVVTAAALIWAAYRFSYGPTAWGNLRLPAPQLFSGLKMVADHNREGHYAYLLGQRSTTGWWYFYLVVLAVKTPLAFLALLAFGGVTTFRQMRSGSASRAWIPLAFSGAILIVGMSSQINIGVRHILPVYIGFSLVAGMALMRMLELGEANRQLRLALVVLLVWMAVSSLKIHPDYLAYFNELAGSHPENVLVDSDLDWGQDMKRLSRRLREAGAPFVTFTPLADPGIAASAGLPADPGVGCAHSIDRLECREPYPVEVAPAAAVEYSPRSGYLARSGASGRTRRPRHHALVLGPGGVFRDAEVWRGDSQ